MKKVILISMLFLGIMSLVGCKKEMNRKKEALDYPVVGTLNFTGSLNIYSLANTGWTSLDTLGIFALSEGHPQNNLPYISTVVNTPKIKSYGGVNYVLYERQSEAQGDVLLKNLGDNPIGFKKGEHNIYAYVPYNKEVKDVYSVTLPYLGEQIGQDGQYAPKREYTFAYAKQTVKEFSAASSSFGAFKTMFAQITFPGAICPQELIGKKYSKIVVSCDKPIAYEQGATIDLTNMKIKGNPLTEIIYKYPSERTITKDRRSDFGRLEQAYVMVAVPFDMAVTYSYTITITIDGRDYSTTGMANVNASKDNNVNLAGIPSFDNI